MNPSQALQQYLNGEGSDRLLWSGLCAFRYDPSPIIRTTPTVETRGVVEGEDRVIEQRAPSGVLTSRKRHTHPLVYPVTTAQDMKVLCEIENDTVLSLDPSMTGSYDPVLSRVSVNTSPVQRLLEYDMGLENFYALLTDEPDLMRELLTVMMRNYAEECRLVATLPVQSVRLVENTSTTMISPQIYEELSLIQVARACEIFHRENKIVISHMCGLLKDLLPLFPRTGIDGIHSVTPPPVGDTTFEMVYAALGDSFRVEGRLGTISWLGKSIQEIRRYLDALITTDRIHRSPFLLEIHCDGMPDVPAEEWRRVQEAVSDWTPNPMPEASRPRGLRRE